MKYENNKELMGKLEKTHNPKVGGSNPPPATNLFSGLQAAQTHFLDHIVSNGFLVSGFRFENHLSLQRHDLRRASPSGHRRTVEIRAPARSGV
jgi:hypothetical protein